MFLFNFPAIQRESLCLLTRRNWKLQLFQALRVVCYLFTMLAISLALIHLRCKPETYMYAVAGDQLLGV